MKWILRGLLLLMGAIYNTTEHRPIPSYEGTRHAVAKMSGTTPDGHSKCPTYGQSNCSNPAAVN